MVADALLWFEAKALRAVFCDVKRGMKMEADAQLPLLPWGGRWGVRAAAAGGGAAAVGGRAEVRVRELVQVRAME